eukprot:gnl/TRDRNA2_/TRDRNA2_91892_c0_seq1.p1 gnl/TRDRNA2_/TRDRNA2_91892_c0~~gnl/TRDRNA2_/TRDRNA2_91892_c0_seq1.p1  ORF type:complete len:334 (+),score=69.77 gnl/TRDRNA2_/TRDRNA2_91892_c0_seq1:82-1002(+)
MDEAEADLQHACEAPEVQLFPMLSYGHISGNRFLERFRDAERRHPVRAVWDPTLKLPTQLIEYISAVCADLAPQVRQEAILLLKRYVHSINSTGNCPKKLPDLQVVGLTCANLAIKHGQQRGIPERKLHWLSRNAFTREDFIDAELDVLQALNCSICWEAALIAEWTALLLYLSSPLLAEAADVKTIGGVVTHLADVLAFQDDLMSSYWPSELAAASIHAAVVLCTKRFQRQSLTLRVGHLVGVPEDQTVRLSERILNAAIGSHCAEFIIEGSGFTDSGESDLEASQQESHCPSPIDSAEHDRGYT